MIRISTNRLRTSATAAICAILFSATCLVAATGPVRAAMPNHEAPRMALPLA
jgi:hypothetical protein